MYICIKLVRKLWNFILYKFIWFILGCRKCLYRVLSPFVCSKLPNMRLAINQRHHKYRRQETYSVRRFWRPITESIQYYSFANCLIYLILTCPAFPTSTLEHSIEICALVELPICALLKYYPHMHVSVSMTSINISWKRYKEKVFCCAKQKLALLRQIVSPIPIYCRSKVLGWHRQLRSHMTMWCISAT